MNFDRLRKTATLRLGESAKVSLPVLVMALVLGALASYLFIQSHNEGIETEASRGDEAAEAAALEAAAQSAPPPRSLFEVVARARNSRSSGQMGPSGPFLSTERGQLTCAVGILIGIALAVHTLGGKLGSFLNRQFDPWSTLAKSPAGAANGVEQEKFSEFVASFRLGPKLETGAEVPAQNSGLDVPTDALQRFFKEAPAALLTARQLFLEAAHVAESDSAKRQDILRELRSRMHAFKGSAGLPGLLPVWQLASALEGLLDQMVDRPATVSSSTLRTAAGALALLDSLSVPGIRSDLTQNPPVKFLAVDDDPICRHAVSVALKKAFQAPEVAENGETALRLAAEQAYDVVFLDVEMPGIDGFEVCTRIHQIPANRQTPVVFVTSHGDFDSRATAASSGGNDFIAKPFLSFEITVKALTLLLRRRLLPQPEMAPAIVAEPSENRLTPNVALRGDSDTALSRARVEPARPAAEEEESAGRRAHVGALQLQWAAVGKADDTESRVEAMGEFFVGIHAFVSELDPGKFKSHRKVASAVEKLCRKLLEKPALATPFAFENVGSALGVLEELCSIGPDVKPGPVSILVVDDDPVSRRALGCALQLAFGKPDYAESGEAALALTLKKTFDLIFLDVLMPGMDGFQACTRIRQTELNAATPVLFVTSRNDPLSREMAQDAGGDGFIPKPVLPAEITLAAVTFALRGRLRSRNEKVATA